MEPKTTGLRERVTRAPIRAEGGAQADIPPLTGATS